MTTSTLARLAGSAAIFGLAAYASPTIALEDEIPEALERIVFGDEKQAITEATVNGTEFSAFRTQSDMPYLIWQMGGTPPPLSMDDADGVRAWLTQGATDLGYEGFEPRFRGTFDWRGNLVWSYELVRHGTVLHDARVNVHWRDGEFLGLVNHISGRIVAIDDHDDGVKASVRVYYEVPEGDGYRAIAATIMNQRLEDRTIVEVFDTDGALLETRHAPEMRGWQRQDDPVFTEYVVPGGSFPDQISVDEEGVVWFSDPLTDDVIEFDPLVEQFTKHQTTGGSGPDGLIVGTQGRVWTGLYYSGSLGLYDSVAGTFTNYPGPYGPASLAIPVETSDGMVWVTDHAYNRMSEFDPSTGTWLQHFPMPTPNCWVVQGHEDVGRRQVYLTEYNANQLGRLDLGGSTVTDIVTPGGGPAFCYYNDDKVYYSRWNESGIGVYDVLTGTITEYEFPVANEGGGPLWGRPNGDIVCGTRNRGYIMVFHVSNETFSALPIPTSSAGLKDGLTVGRDDVIWFTETGRNKLGKLEFCIHTCPADFNGDGEVNTLDVLAFLNAYTASDPSADINEDGDVNTLDVLAFLNLWNEGC